MKIRPCGLGASMTFAHAKTLQRNFADAHAFPEHTHTIALNVGGPVRNWRTDFLFDYEVFPPHIMRFDAEWLAAARNMTAGDVIIQRTMLPPIGFGICVEFAVRISSVFEEENRVGFSYETLSGHAERGVSAFYFEEKGGAVFFTIRTLSQPGHWTARLVSRMFTLPFQAWCTRRALARVRDRFQKENAALISAQPGEHQAR